jgi:hypothetical protein
MAFADEGAVIPPVKKSQQKKVTICRLENWKEATWKENIHSNINMNVIKLQRTVKCHEDHIKSNTNAIKANKAARYDVSAKPPTFVSPYFARIQRSRPATPAPIKLAPDQAKARRAAIGYMYTYVLFRPHPDTWSELHVVTAIMQTQNIPPGSFRTVKSCLLDIESQLAANPGNNSNHQKTILSVIERTKFKRAQRKLILFSRGLLMI